ncbi:hypothetical protein JZO78_11440 [Enterococcus ureilyticus]|uniref:hypothetical protein n=1 Tax=Enterococcus ureilyticus TaxID=1131292 RepID=UPI001A90D6D2|nr:hypothetical protein [Enterococcus ureilyticus]MBO0446959.1 hypothetical protein [Enterococcus ureilyticus]
MDITIPKEYGDVLNQGIYLNWTGRRKYYVYLDYTSDGDNYYYVGKGSGDRVLDEKRNDIHGHYKKQKGLERRIILEDLTETEALNIENLFIHYSIQSGIYITNMIIEDYRFVKEYTFDELLMIFIDYFKQSTFDETWIDKITGVLNQFDHVEIATIFIEAYLNVKDSYLCIDNSAAMLIKDSLKNENYLTRIYLNNIISEIDNDLEDEEFERFLEESLKIAESIETSLDIAIQRDRCIGKLQKNLPSLYY